MECGHIVGRVEPCAAAGLLPPLALGQNLFDRHLFAIANKAVVVGDQRGWNLK